MTEIIRGDVLTREEMKMRGICVTTTERGGFELRTHASLETIAMFLIKKGFIEYYHYDDATIFMDLRRAYETSIGIKWGHVKIDFESLGLTPGDASERYDAIRHMIGLTRFGLNTKFILQAMLEPYQEMRVEAWVVYKDAFERLTNAMMEVKKKYESPVA